MMERLPTHIWVAALLKRAHNEGAFATLAKRGDEARGTVIVRLVMASAHHVLLIPEHRLDGQMGFTVYKADYKSTDPCTDPQMIDRYLDKQSNIDPDLWIIDIEGSKGAHFLLEPVTGMETLTNQP